VAGVIGDPVRHSLSPIVHNAAFRALDLDWAYLSFEVRRGDVPAAIAGVRALGIDGLSVTMPHKEAVATAIDRLSSRAERLGAVNTVVNQAGVLVGESTDGRAFIDALLDEGFDPAGRRCAVVGAGGAARAVILALAEHGASEILIINRTPSRAEAALLLAGEAGRVAEQPDIAGADLVVNATPAGMRATDDLPVDPQHLHANQLVADLIYAPAITPLMHEARARGAATVNGLGMLIHQAAAAFRLWTGLEPPLEVMSAAAMATLLHPPAQSPPPPPAQSPPPPA
jgi:shikimate dehydrogenase